MLRDSHLLYFQSSNQNILQIAFLLTSVESNQSSKLNQLSWVTEWVNEKANVLPYPKPSLPLATRPCSNQM